MTKTNQILIVFLVATLLALFLNNQARLAALDKAQSTEGKLTYLTQSFDSLKNKYGVVVAQQVAAQTASEQELKKLSAEIFDLKRKDEARIKQVNALIRIAQEAGVDSVYIPYTVHDTISTKDTVPCKDCVQVPKQVELVTDSITFRGTVEKQGFKINTLSITDTLTLRVTEQKKGIFSPRQTVVQAIHSSPMVRTTGMNSITLKQRQNAWNRIIKPALGLAAGLFLGHQLAK